MVTGREVYLLPRPAWLASRWRSYAPWALAVCTFTLIEHKRTLPPPGVVHAALHEALRAGKTIELPPET